MFEKRLDVDPFLARLNAMVRSYVAEIWSSGTDVRDIHPGILARWIGAGRRSRNHQRDAELDSVPWHVSRARNPVGCRRLSISQFRAVSPHRRNRRYATPDCRKPADSAIVGSRLDIGPVPAMIGLLFWDGCGVFWVFCWLFPWTAFIKLLADADPSLAHLSSFLARDPERPILRRRRPVVAQTSVSPETSLPQGRLTRPNSFKSDSPADVCETA
jgi:hypothetical protein